MKAGARGRLPVAVVAIAMAAPVAVAAGIAWNANSHHAPAVKTLPPAAGTAASALRQVATAMEATVGYHFTGTVRSGGETISITGEFAAPDRLHETLTAAGAPPIERIVIGGRQYQRAGTAWQPVTGSSTTDPRATFGALVAATSVSAQPGGYAFTLAGTAATQLVSGAPARGTTVTGTVEVRAGTITDIAYRSADSSQTSVDFAYSDVGTAPPITAPPTA
ncbi:MAG TPA: hypothetical protein VMU14_05645 [Acidimicrobiales bacterium]|nr:hypothetical protein [Acidimicrobiales bacterium]